MKTLDRVTELEPQLRPLLAAGERLREALRVELTAGTDEARDAERRDRVRHASESLITRSAAEPGTTRSVGDRALDAAAGFVTGTTPFHTPNAPDLPNPNGTGLSGAAGSIAVQVRDSLSRGPGSAGHSGHPEARATPNAVRPGPPERSSARAVLARAEQR